MAHFLTALRKACPTRQMILESRVVAFCLSNVEHHAVVEFCQQVPEGFSLFPSLGHLFYGSQFCVIEFGTAKVEIELANMSQGIGDGSLATAEHARQPV